VTLNRQEGRLVLHLVNHHAGDPERLSIGGAPLVLRGVEVALDVGRLGLRRTSTVQAVPSGAAVNSAMRDDLLSFTVPGVTISTVLALQ
jgi:hypothetical protein